MAIVTTIYELLVRYHPDGTSAAHRRDLATDTETGKSWELDPVPLVVSSPEFAAAVKEINAVAASRVIELTQITDGLSQVAEQALAQAADLQARVAELEAQVVDPEAPPPVAE